MNKYGTAEFVQKKDGKAIISENELTKDDLTKIADGTIRKKKVVVTSEDYRVEDEADIPSR